MTWWKAVIVGVLLLAVGGVTAKGLSDRTAPPVEVQLSKAHRGTLTRTVAGTGKVQAATTIKISSNLSGTLMDRPVKVGDRVTRGQILGRIDRRIYEAAAKQAQAGVSAARADMQVAQVEVDRTAAELGRQQKLAQTNMASSADVEQSRAARDTALARLASAKEHMEQSAAQSEQADKNLSMTTLVSPIEGSVIETSREVGERVRGSDFSEDVVMTLAALSAMEVRIDVGEHEVVHLKLGQKADVTIDAIEGQTFEGTVSEIAQNAQIRNANTEAEVINFPVKVALASRPPGVLPGMSAEVHVATDTRSDALLIPISAVTVRPDKSLPDHRPTIETNTTLTAPHPSETLAKVVFVVDGTKHARVRRVKTGISSNSDYEILDGLQDGDQVVQGPYRTLAKELKDGDEVTEEKAPQRT